MYSPQFLFFIPGNLPVAAWTYALADISTARSKRGDAVRFHGCIFGLYASVVLRLRVERPQALPVCHPHVN
jgi:hypothetical protein